MRWLVETLQRYPEVAIFLTLAVGFAIGGIKFGKFSLGNVTGVLVAGVLIGQIIVAPIACNAVIASDVDSLIEVDQPKSGNSSLVNAPN